MSIFNSYVKLPEGNPLMFFDCMVAISGFGATRVPFDPNEWLILIVPAPYQICSMMYHSKRPKNMNIDSIDPI